MKGLIILFGESFRLGSQGNRNRGSNESYNEQIKAAESHMRFIKHLKTTKNIDIDVHISSYETQFSDNLNAVYLKVLGAFTFYHGLLGQNTLIQNALKNITNIDEYDFALIMRIDLFLKNKFDETFDPYSDKILFPSICFKPHHKAGNHPRVNDMMMFVPKKYFNLLNKINLHHGTWYDLVVDHGRSYQDLDVMLNTYHDSDSEKDYNPIYYIVNRPENSIHHTKDLFDKYNFE